MGNSPCNFLTFNTSIGYNPVGTHYQAQFDLHFGRPGQARDSVLASTALESTRAHGRIQTAREKAAHGLVSLLHSLYLGDGNVTLAHA